MICATHDYEGELPCPWPDCPNGRGAFAQNFNVRRPAVIGPIVPGRRIDEAVFVNVETYERKSFGYSAGRGGISRMYAWNPANAPATRPAPLPHYDVELCQRVSPDAVNDAVCRLAKMLEEVRRSRFKVMSEEPLGVLIADALRPWIGAVAMLGSLLLAWGGGFFGSGGRFCW